MKRILCLDIGLSRTGVAVSDGLGITAQGVEVIAQKDFYSVIKRVNELLEIYDVDKILVGYPLRTDGKYGEKAAEIEEKKRLLEKKTKKEVVLWDERFSTKIAELALVDKDPKKQKQVVDMLAAQVILQSYLDYLSLHPAVNTEKENKIEDISIKKGIKNMENETIIVKTDDGQEVEYIVDVEFEFEGKNYVVLCAAEDDEEAILFRLEEDEEGVLLYDLEDDEFDAVNDFYITLFDEEDEEDEE
ncbi:MAG: Holliday junction resolvase RuvX [Anaerofustis stercorihominis]|nr:Holliday junction resolvase RuvX [Anaerofustis stercorihominis]